MEETTATTTAKGASLASMVQSLSSTEGSSPLADSSTSSSPNATSAKPKASKNETVDEDHIAKLDIRVGIIRSVSTHPDAESLYIEQGEIQS